MNYISTTNLRTQSSKLVDFLKQGNMVSLVHRSKIIGEISPISPNAKSFDIKRFRVFVKITNPAKNISYQERNALYRKRLKEKYGKNLS